MFTLTLLIWQVFILRKINIAAGADGTCVFPTIFIKLLYREVKSTKLKSYLLQYVCLRLQSSSLLHLSLSERPPLVLVDGLDDNIKHYHMGDSGATWEILILMQALFEIHPRVWCYFSVTQKAVMWGSVEFYPSFPLYVQRECEATRRCIVFIQKDPKTLQADL